MFDFKLFELLLTLREHGSVFLVGGCVRDMLLGVMPKDHDVCVGFDPFVAGDDLRANGWVVKEAGQRFCVMHCQKGGVNYEVAMFRNDGAYLNGKPVQVTPGDMHTDAHRRDFTVNALYLNPFTDEIHDPTGFGLNDVREKTLRFVGKPKDRLNEDPVRVFRFYRFVSKGFKPVQAHLRVVRGEFANAHKKLVECGGSESVRNELEKLLGGML